MSFCIKEPEEGIWVLDATDQKIEVDLNEGTIKAFKLERSFLKEKYSDTPERVWNFDTLDIKAGDLLLCILKSMHL